MILASPEWLPFLFIVTFIAGMIFRDIIRREMERTINARNNPPTSPTRIRNHDDS